MSGRPRNFERDDVLTKAMLAFWRRGFEATSLSDLEAATGLGRQSLYAVFGNKQTLFLAAVDRYFNLVIKPGFVDVLDQAESGMKGVLKVLELWESAANSPGFSGCLIGNSSLEMGTSDPAIAELLQRKFDLMREALVRALERAKKAGEITTLMDSNVMAASLLAIAQGLAVLTRVNQDPALIHGVLRSARGLLDVPN